MLYVQLRIVFDAQDPPVGTVERWRPVDGPAMPGEEAIPFVGWMGLLRVLADILVRHWS